MSREEQRSHVRVAAKMAARFRSAQDEELEALERQIASRGALQRTKVDPELLDHVARLERKLDLVLSMLSQELPEPLMPTEAREIEISAAGFGYQSEAPAPVGELVLCELLLPGIPPHPVRAVGRTISSDAVPGGGFRVAFSFEHIDEADRDGIVRFVNRTQIASRQRND